MHIMAITKPRFMTLRTNDITSAKSGAKFSCRSQSWFQFNDETVTKIKSLGEKPNTKIEIIEIEDDDEEK